MKNTLVLIILLTTSLLYGQNIQDALRMSEQSYYSSARASGVGGAYGAIGADFGSIAYNPASVAAFRTSEFTFGFSSNRTRSDAYLVGDENNRLEEATHKKFKLENAGLVIYHQPQSSNWTSANFSFGLTRLANFDQQINYKGETTGSYTDRFLERANGRDLDGLDNFEAGLAYDVGAIWGPDEQLEYTSDYLFTPNDRMEKQQSITSRGGIYEMSFAYGANYQDNIHFGLSIGVPFLNYTEDKSYTETPVDIGSVFQYLQYNQELITSGVGINFKAGMVAKLNKVFRIGAAIHSPSWYYLQDDYNASMIYEFNEGDGLQSYEDGSPDGYFKYTFKTPWRYIASAGAVFRTGDLGVFIDFDAEYSDYSTGEFDFTAYSSSIADKENGEDQNEKISKELKPSMTYRLGGELAYGKWRGRLGFITAETPFENDNISDAKPGYSFGIGYRAWKYYIDFAFVNLRNSYSYTPYELQDRDLEQLVTIDKTRRKWQITVGRKF